MATFDGSFSGVSASNVKPYIDWSYSQDIVGNYSDITSRLYYTRVNHAYSGYNNTGSATANSNIDGNVSNSNVTFDLRGGTYTQLIRTVTQRVYHNADGTRSSWIGYSGATNISWGTFNFGQTVALPTIPREAYITNSVDFTIGNNIPLTLYNAGNMYVQSLLYVNGSLIKTTNHGQTSSTTVTLGGAYDTAIYAQTPNTTAVSMYVRIKTYSDAGYSVQVGGNRDQSGTAYVNTATNAPTFTTYTVASVDKTYNVVDKYSNALVTSQTNTLTGSAQKIINGYSKIRGTVTSGNKMVALNSATSIKYRFVNGLQATDGTYSAGSTVDMDIDNATAIATTMTAYDSRALTTAGTPVSLTSMVDYTPPVLSSLVMTRDNQIDAPTTFTIAGSYWKEYFGGGVAGVQNTINAHYRFKPTTQVWATNDGVCTMTIASPCVVTKSSHGLSTGDPIFFTTTGALPTGLSVNTTYYVIYINSSTFNVATTYANAIGGTKINTSGSQSGTHTLYCSSAWTSLTLTDSSGILSYATYLNGDLGAGGFNTGRSFTVEVRIYDKLNSYILEGTLDRGTPLIDFTQSGIAINAIYDSSRGGNLQVAQPSWTAPSFSNSWVNYGSGFATCGYMKDSMGFVHLRGLVKDGSAMNTTIFTLPTGFRPTEQWIFGVASNNAYGEVRVASDGTVKAPQGATAWVSLDGIVFNTA